MKGRGFIVLAGRAAICYTTDLALGQKMADMHRGHPALYERLCRNAHAGMVPFITTLENANLDVAPMQWRAEMNGWSGPPPRSPEEPFYRIERMDWGLASPKPVPARG